MTIVGHLYGVSALVLVSGPNINTFASSMNSEHIANRISRQQKELLISASVDSTLRFWNITSRRCVSTLNGFPDPVSMTIGETSTKLQCEPHVIKYLFSFLKFLKLTQTSLRFLVPVGYTL